MPQKLGARVTQESLNIPLNYFWGYSTVGAIMTVGISPQTLTELSHYSYYNSLSVHHQPKAYMGTETIAGQVT